MTPLPKGPTTATRASLPFTPTVHDNNPTVCMCCGRRAWGVGVGDPSKGDPKYLCAACVIDVEHIRKVKRWDLYELAALDDGVEAVGEYIATHGITELSHFDELMQRMLVKAAWQGAAAGLRKRLEEGSAPF